MKMLGRGLVLFNNSTRFTVLDICTKGDITQVFLTTGADMLASQNLVDHAITAARKDLDELAGSPAAEALTTDAWKQRVAYPLGLNDQGEPVLKNQ